MQESTVYTMSELSARRAERGGAYLPFLDVPALSCGVYELARGATDHQQPHERDEIYYVSRGKATFVSDGKRTIDLPFDESVRLSAGFFRSGREGFDWSVQGQLQFFGDSRVDQVAQLLTGIRLFQAGDHSLRQRLTYRVTFRIAADQNRGDLDVCLP